MHRQKQWKHDLIQIKGFGSLIKNLMSLRILIEYKDLIGFEEHPENLPKVPGTRLKLLEPTFKQKVWKALLQQYYSGCCGVLPHASLTTRCGSSYRSGMDQCLREGRASEVCECPSEQSRGSSLRHGATRMQRAHLGPRGFEKHQCHCAWQLAPSGLRRGAGAWHSNTTD